MHSYFDKNRRYLYCNVKKTFQKELPKRNLRKNLQETSLAILNSLNDSEEDHLNLKERFLKQVKILDSSFHFLGKLQPKKSRRKERSLVRHSSFQIKDQRLEDFISQKNFCDFFNKKQVIEQKQSFAIGTKICTVTRRRRLV